MHKKLAPFWTLILLLSACTPPLAAVATTTPVIPHPLSPSPPSTPSPSPLPPVSPTSPKPPLTLTLSVLQMLDRLTGWALATTCDEAGCNPYRFPRTLQRTTNGGQTWQSLQPQLVP